jgi:hypothetical protein
MLRLEVLKVKITGILRTEQSSRNYSKIETCAMETTQQLLCEFSILGTNIVVVS